MNKLAKQLLDYFGRAIQVITWGDLIERTFRPVITPNQVRAGWVNRVVQPDQSGRKPVTHPHRR